MTHLEGSSPCQDSLRVLTHYIHTEMRANDRLANFRFHLEDTVYLDKAKTLRLTSTSGRWHIGSVSKTICTE